MSVADSLTRRATQICDPEYLDDELKFIQKILIYNNFPKHEIEYKIYYLRGTLSKSGFDLLLALHLYADLQVELTSERRFSAWHSYMVIANAYSTIRF